MKINKSVLVLSIFLLSFIQVSCNKKEPCTFPVHDSYFTFNLIDRYGNNLIAKWGARYLSDSILLTKSNGEYANQLEIREGGHISFFIPESSTEALDSTIARQFFLYLPDNNGRPKADSDTITFEYQFNKANYQEAQVPCYSSFRILYNDSLYHDGDYIDIFSFIKN